MFHGLAKKLDQENQIEFRSQNMSNLHTERDRGRERNKATDNLIVGKKICGCQNRSAILSHGPGGKDKSKLLAGSEGEKKK